MSELPAGWRLAKLGELAEYLNGAAFKPSDWEDEGMPIIRIQNLTDPSKPMNRTTRAVDERLRVHDGDILVSWSATLDAFIWSRGEAWLNQHIFRVLPNERVVDKQFLFFLFRKEIASLIETEHLHGSTMRHINRGPFLSHQVALPPLNEQRRIVTKLDSLLTRSKRAREELARIPRLVERMKQAILAAAFSGELTREWRALQPEITAPQLDRGGIDSRVADVKEVPDSWAWTSIGNVALVTGGLTKNAKRNSIVNRAPYLRVANVYANELRLDDVAEIGCTEVEFAKTRLQVGDLLIVEGNGSLDQIGRIAIWNGEIEGCSHQNHLIRARPNTNIVPRYALFWLLSPYGRSSIERVASSSSSLHTLSISKVEGLPIPVCGIREQDEIVRRIETAFTRIDLLVAEATRATALLDRLDQATLAKAFRGELLTNEHVEQGQL